MRNLFFSTLLTFILMSAAVQAQQVSSIKITQIVEELGKNDDTTRIVNVWATWCAPCVKELPYFEEVNQSYQGKKIKIILLAVEDTPESVNRFVTKKNIQSQVFVLDETDAAYWIPKIQVDWQGEIPVTLMVNNAHQLRKFHAGELTKESLIQLIEASSN